MLDNVNGEAMREHFDLPTRAVLGFLNAKEVSKVQIMSPEDDAGIWQHLAYFKCANQDGSVTNFALSGGEISQALSILESTKTIYGDDTHEDRMKAVEQILITVSQHLKKAEEIGFVIEDVPVWSLQPYCRDWDVHSL